MKRLMMVIGLIALTAHAGDLDWPVVTREMKPWAYWWWMGSAVDPTNLTKELQRYHNAGMGGVHIIPIYGAKGWEDKYIPYLSTNWMAMLRHTVTEAQRLGMGVDMTTGSGWCFGGPEVTRNEASAVAVYDAKKNTVTQKPTSRVKRAAPGGEGFMLNPFYADAMRHFLQRFTDAFAKYDGPKPRSMYHDSFEYQVNWSPDLLTEFEKRRGYRLQDHFAKLFTENRDDVTARVKCDYRETISDMMVENSFPLWTKWSRDHGFLTRNQAHGSPGNILDLYALADIPETEMFHTERNRFISKFASSAAHVTGKQLTASETGTWLKEHFTETLADVKGLVDDLFLSDVNHVIYHGTCYSPDEAGWPGWLFYAATEMNPRNAFWHDVPALNAYIARCQSILQSGQSDNDVLLYWPIHDLWQSSRGMTQNLTVHAHGWLEDQPIGKVAQQLWNRGYSFDYISDRQSATITGRRVIVVPPCKHMPVATLARLLELAEKGSTVIFVEQVPTDVPGLSNLDARRAELRKLAARVQAGELEPQLVKAGVARETLVDQPGLLFIRRTQHYFIVNTGAEPVDGWVPLAKPGKSVGIMDPLTGRAGLGAVRGDKVYLQLPSGASVILRTFAEQSVGGPSWPYLKPTGPPVPVTGTWQVKFIAGGPELPSVFATDKLGSWTGQGGAAESFAGTAIYSVTFDAASSGTALLDLGKVCESARVRVNGKDCGALIMPPYRIVVDGLKPVSNVLEVEVTNLSANRIRDLDRRKVVWRKFNDINFVNIDYKPFDASNWPVRDSGLLGPVTLTPVGEVALP